MYARVLIIYVCFMCGDRKTKDTKPNENTRVFLASTSHKGRKKELRPRKVKLNELGGGPC